MTKVVKKYKVKVTRKGRDSFVEETLEGLLKHFSYTFEVGYSWNNKINRQPKTIKSFISNLQKSYEEKEAQCYERTSVELVS